MFSSKEVKSSPTADEGNFVPEGLTTSNRPKFQANREDMMLEKDALNSEGSLGKGSRLLLVDDDKSTVAFLSSALSNMGFHVTSAYSLKETTDLLNSRDFAIVVSDIFLDHEDGTNLLSYVQKATSAPSLIFMTGFGDVDVAVKTLQEGAFDFISKTNNLSEMVEDLRQVLERALKHREATVSRRATPPTTSSHGEERTLVGRCPSMIRLYRMIAKASLARENVLILGESGTGKELVARAIHDKGPWKDKPFVAVNCCALTETLLESELFGHVRGSFTGANQNKRGLFEEADGGTLFLDEIGDISLSLQVKLLRALQEGEIKAVGATASKRVDVRIIAATHRSLEQYISEGKFREDLFYRLKVIPIDIPPLRERKEDLPELVGHFLSRYNRRSGRDVLMISDDAMDVLIQYSWPGNIRELENAINHAAAMTSSSIVLPDDLPPEIQSHSRAMHENRESAKDGNGYVTGGGESMTASSSEGAREQSLEELEKKHIARTLQKVNFNKSKAAEILGIDRVTLYRKAFKYGILTRKK